MPQDPVEKKKKGRDHEGESHGGEPGAGGEGEEDGVDATDVTTRELDKDLVPKQTII